VFQLVLGPFTGDPLTPRDLEPGRGDRRLHRRLVHARRRVLQPLDQQAPVSGGELVGGEHRIEHHPTAGSQHPGALRQHLFTVPDARQDVPTPHQIAGAIGDREGLQVALDQRDLSVQAGRGGVGPALGQPRRHQVDAQDPAAVAAGQGDGVGGVPAAGVQDQLAGVQAEPARGLQQQLRRPGAQAPVQQLLTLGGPALVGVQLGQDPTGGWVGHGSDAGTAAHPRRGSFPASSRSAGQRVCTSIAGSART
jgi:hypothetical protein